eukprot:scaffold1536_cov166-Amphora_coffeaeformis.AAC.1
MFAVLMLVICLALSVNYQPKRAARRSCQPCTIPYFRRKPSSKRMVIIKSVHDRKTNQTITPISRDEQVRHGTHPWRPGHGPRFRYESIGTELLLTVMKRRHSPFPSKYSTYDSNQGQRQRVALAVKGDCNNGSSDYVSLVSLCSERLLLRVCSARSRGVKNAVPNFPANACPST